jgi:hypothetical protein
VFPAFRLIAGSQAESDHAAMRIPTRRWRRQAGTSAPRTPDTIDARATVVDDDGEVDVSSVHAALHRSTLRSPATVFAALRRRMADRFESHPSSIHLSRETVSARGPR